jgi:hypothetical protein
MKHIKPFNESTEFDFNNELYKKVNLIQGQTYYQNHNTEPFTNNQLLIIKNVLSTKPNYIIEPLDNKEKIILRYISNDITSSVTIRKMQDDIYYIRHYTQITLVREQFYLCDQFDGLLKFINDKL